MHQNPEFIYVHIPFCSSKCKYCSFTSFAAYNFIDCYLKSLKKEIKHFYKGNPVQTLYIGGGTPSLLNGKQLESVISLFNFKENFEITVELNPETASLKLLSELKKMKVNRLSLGIQSFNDEILEEIGRKHTAKQAKDAYYLCKDTGFNNVSIDLMYGLPAQSISDWDNTLQEALKLEPEHISLYGLKIEDGTVYGKKTPKKLPDDDMQADMYELALKKLNRYLHYEISNFSLDCKYVSRHNLSYWNEENYWGFGISASGFTENKRYQNTRNFKDYKDNPINKDYVSLTEKELLEETIFLGFRKTEGIDINIINKKFNINFDKKYENVIQKYLSSKHIETTDKGYRLSQKGIMISNNILCDFLC